MLRRFPSSEGAEKEKFFENELEFYREVSLLIYEISELCVASISNYKGFGDNTIQILPKQRYLFRFISKIFFAVRRIAERFGIKDRMKKSNFYKKLYLRGTIDKFWKSR